MKTFIILENDDGRVRTHCLGDGPRVPVIHVDYDAIRDSPRDMATIMNEIIEQHDGIPMGSIAENVIKRLASSIITYYDSDKRFLK